MRQCGRPPTSSGLSELSLVSVDALTLRRHISSSPSSSPSPLPLHFSINPSHTHNQKYNASRSHRRHRPRRLRRPPTNARHALRLQNIHSQPPTRRPSRRTRESESHNPHRLLFVLSRAFRAIERRRRRSVGTGNFRYTSIEAVRPPPTSHQEYKLKEKG